jgi:hypothetical protein
MPNNVDSKIFDYIFSKAKSLEKATSALTLFAGASLMAIYILNRKVKDLYKEIQILKEKE